MDAVIIVKEASEIEAVRQRGEFDVLRRNVVFPTADETAGLTAIFEPPASPPADVESAEQTDEIAPEISNSAPENSNRTPANERTEPNAPAEIIEIAPVLSEEDALAELPAIPLYFPTSYSLVKPYVQGFEINTLDAPSLKDVRIDNNWQPKKADGES